MDLNRFQRLESVDVCGEGDAVSEVQSIHAISEVSIPRCPADRNEWWKVLRCEPEPDSISSGLRTRLALRMDGGFYKFIRNPSCRFQCIVSFFLFLSSSGSIWFYLVLGGFSASHSEAGCPEPLEDKPKPPCVFGEWPPTQPNSSESACEFAESAP